jgi:Tol biopolymer transport system component
MQYVVDGKPGPQFNRSALDDDLDWGPSGGDFIFSANSAHTAYIMADKNGQQQVAVDGKPGLAFPGILHGLTLSPDGLRSAFVVEFGHDTTGNMSKAFHQSNWMVVLDGQPGPKFDSVRPRFAFNPDGSHVAYAAETAKQWRIYADGATGPAFERIIAGPVVGDDGRLEYLALQKDGATNNLVRVTMPGFAVGKP